MSSKPIAFIFLAALICFHLQAQPGKPELSSLYLADPFIGTANADQQTSWGAEGGTYPGAVAPWGVVQLSPETKTGNRSGYDFRDSTIYFFSCTDHASGYPNGSAGRARVLPLSSLSAPGNYSNGRPFGHDREKAEPSYYSVQFSDDGGSAEMTASARTGFFRFRFPGGSVPKIFLGEMGNLRQQSKTLIYGDHRNIAIRFASPIASIEQVAGGMICTFAPQNDNNTVLLKISVSTVNHQASMRSMQAECAAWDLDTFRIQNQQQWQKILSVVEVEDNSLENKKKFYTALYHSCLVPWIVSDADGRYRGADRKIYRAKGKNHYSKFSPWDTFRSLHPLLTLLYPEVQADMLRSMLSNYEQTGRLPKGPMTGYHSLAILLDSYQKNVHGSETKAIWQAMKHSLESEYKNPDYASYLNNGYVSYDFSESVTKTVEFAYNDWAMSEMARVIADTAALRSHSRKSAYYQNLLHPASGFLLPRRNGDVIAEPASRGYKEGDKWIYSFFVPHDPRALVNLLGGDSAFSEKLDSALTAGKIPFDNEPAFHVPYLFNFSNRPSLTQKWVRTIMADAYSASPGGIPGNDDLGSMSSWFVFSAMGIYPFCPGRPVSEIGSPLFKKVNIHLPSGKTFTINAAENARENMFVKNLRLNNKPLNYLFLTHNEIAAGGNLDIEMSRSAADSNFITMSYDSRSATALPAAISVEKIMVDDNRTTAGDPVVVRFVLSNRGEAGVHNVQLLCNGNIYSEKKCLVAAGSGLEDSFSLTIYKPGTYRIAIDNSDAAVLEVELPEKVPVVKTKFMTLDVKPVLKTGEKQKILLKAQNITGFSDTTRAEVFINDSLLFSEELIILPGDTIVLKKEWICGRAGRFMIRAAGLSAAFVVYDQPRGAQVMNLPIDPGSGDTITDLSAFGNHGRRISEVRMMENGKRDSVVIIETKNSQSLDQLGHAITVMAWIYPTSRKGLADIVTKGDFIVFQQSGSTLSFFAGGWGQGSCDVFLPENWENNWHHIAGVCDKNLFRIYIDGVETGSFTIDHAVNLSTTARWTIGGNEEFPDQRFFKGHIRNVKVYAAALIRSEIKQEMAGPPPNK